MKAGSRDVTCAHVQLMHIFRIFGQTCAEYRLQETCSINYQVQHAPLLAARLRHHHEIDHQWQQIRSHVAQAIWPKPFLVRCLLAAAMADPATKARLGERLASLPAAKLHTIACALNLITSGNKEEVALRVVEDLLQEKRKRVDCDGYTPSKVARRTWVFRVTFPSPPGLPSVPSSIERSGFLTRAQAGFGCTGCIGGSSAR